MTLKPVIFTGPTLSVAEANEFMSAIYLPPAAQGDMLAAYNRYKPAVMGLIDGYFQNVPAVLHKEILYLMDKGVHVIGAASMGALRAAELHSFGMVGIGQIFEAYRQARLEDDDEVAVIHGPESLGYPLLSEAMVNIRQTLLDAKTADILSMADYERVLSIAKNIHYKKRTYALLLSLAAMQGGVPEGNLAKLKQWLSEGRRDIKKEDALALLNYIKAMQTQTLEPKKILYRFQNTIYWEDLVDAIR